MDPKALWQGETADDTVDETAIFGLWLPGFQSSQDVDFLAVLGHNLKAFDWDLSNDNGTTYPGGNKQAKTLQATPQTIVSLNAPIASDKLKLTMHTTQTANALKQVGALVVAKAQLQGPSLALFQRLPLRVKDRSAKMYDNSTRRSFVYRSAASYTFRDFAVGFKGLTQAEADSLEAVLTADGPFIFYPRPGDRPGEMYLGQAMPGTYHRDYDNLAAGTEFVTFDFEEAGGA